MKYLLEKILLENIITFELISKLYYMVQELTKKGGFKNFLPLLRL
jgi:hypothetical protein